MPHFSSLLSAPRVCLLLALFWLALRLPAAAQAPAWQSARAVAAALGTTNNYSVVTATAVDAAGNVFVAGHFGNTVVLGGTTLTSAGGDDVFVAKFNPASNQFVWAQRAGGGGNDDTYALAVNGPSVYVCGIFESATAGFGATNLTKAGTSDGFVAKLTDAGASGSFVWAQRTGGAGADRAAALAVSGTSVYVAGHFEQPAASFGPVTLTSAGSSDVFAAKLIDAGTTASFVWAQRAGGTSSDQALAVAVSGANVYVAGFIGSATADFGATGLANASGSGSPDVFVAKLTDAGATAGFVWAQRAGSTNSDAATALAVSGSNVYVAGFFAATTAPSFGSITLNGAGSFDAFVAKLTDTGSTGSFVWAQPAGGTGIDRAYALAASGNSVYVAGYFDSPTAGFGSATLANAGASDVYVAKLMDAGPTGSFVWAQGGGGAGLDQAYALALSGGNAYVAGLFGSSTASFGAVALPNPVSPINLGFLASLTDPTLTATAPSRALPSAQLFPNPAHGMATLRLLASTAPAPLTLTDALGRAVRRYPAPVGPEVALDLRGLPAGLYLLRGAGAAVRLAVE